MAEVLTVDQMLANTAEPLRVFRWILALDGIDAFTCMTITRPGGGTFGETEINYINQRRYIAGRFKPDEMTLKLWDPIAPSASQKVLEWVRLNYENQTGRAGYWEFYKKDFDLKLLDPPGGVAQQWQIQGAWPQAVKFNEMSYSEDGTANVDLTIRYNAAVLLF